MLFNFRLGSQAKRLSKGIVAVVLAGALVACSSIYRNHGYVPDEKDLAQLEIGKDTQETAAAKIGRPSTSGLLNGNDWYFVQSRYEERGALEAKEVDRQVVAVYFNDNGKLENIEKWGLERGQIVPLSRRVTESSVRSMGVLRQIFASFGRVSAAQIIK